MRVSWRNIFLFCYFAILICGTFSNSSAQNNSIAVSGKEYKNVTPDGAWCWFADPRAVYYEGKTYIGWVNQEGSIIIGVYDPETDDIQSHILSKELESDDHDNPAILFQPDGRIMVFYSEHGGRDMFLRVSKNSEDITSWGPERSLKLNQTNWGYTYPNPVMLSQEENRTYLFWRGDEWKPCFSTSTDLGENWSKAEILITSEGARPYMKIASNGKDKIHFAFTDGHPRNEPVNSIYYAMYQNGAFYKADGSKIKDLNSLPMDRQESDLVFDGRVDSVRSWIWDVAFDEEDHPVIVYTRLPEETDHRYHYARWNGEKWIDNEISPAGKWFPETPENKREPEPHYSGGIILDHSNPSIVFLSRQINGVFEIEKWTTNDSGNSWESVLVTENSTGNNVRPVTIRNKPQNVNPDVLWMNNRKYIHYTNYNTAIKMDISEKPFSGEIEPDEIMSAMEKVADWQLYNSSRHNVRGWQQGAYYAGMTDFALMADNPKYLEAMRSVGEENRWQPGNRIYHADDFCVGQMYLEMYNQYRDPGMIKPIKSGYDWILNNPSPVDLEFGTPKCRDRWCWCDALFMSPPVLTKLSAVTGDKKYIDFMDSEFWLTTEYLYDKEEHLFYRDSRYFTMKEENGKKLFWSRGNGWVIAGIARILRNMPIDYPSRPQYIELYKEMAAKIARIQPEDGLWRPSLLDPGSYPSQETSGSGFFCYALTWGVNNGILDRAEYLPVIKKAWKGLTASVHLDGKLGWVQPVGASPKEVTGDLTEVYGVGAFLLAGTEMYKLAHLDNVQRVKISVVNPTTTFRLGAVVSLEWKELTKNVPSLNQENIAVFDNKTGRFLLNQTIDYDEDDNPDEFIFQSDFTPNEARTFYIVTKQEDSQKPEINHKAFSMFVPQRKDDFAWENDRIAFRMYGPALQESGEISSGVDIWAKSVRYPILEKWYELDNYHSDHGEGLDFYKVGPSRGCGGIGIWKDGKIYASENYTSWKIISNGPIRTIFELTYKPWETGGQRIEEVKRISLDKGSNLSRFESRFKVLEGQEDFSVAIGIVKRGNAGEAIYNTEAGWMGYWQPEERNKGILGCGVVMSPEMDKAAFQDIDDHCIFIIKGLEDKPFVYFAGAGWTKSGDFLNRDEWNNYLEKFALHISNPLEIKIISKEGMLWK
ncbi:MAG: DUF4861 domain-containing protein [bacterium]|nr:DUF4861 domain-containing protein [bacterium]